MKDTLGLSHRKKECHRNNARLYNPQKSLFEEEEEDKEEDKEEEDKGRDEREPPQRCSTTKTAHVDTTYYHYMSVVFIYLLNILTQHFF